MLIRTLFLRSFFLFVAILFLALGTASAQGMQELRSWNGPFDDTQIIKLADPEDGVICYLYIPKNVPTNNSCNSKGCALVYPSGIGTISCIKLPEKTGNDRRK